MAAAVLPIPSPLRRRLEETHARMLQPDPGRAIDFASPPGEPAMAAPDSVSWQVFKNPLTLFVGGVAAVILELAEPRVRAGVWDHSSFRRDPLGRLQRTGLAAMVQVYGPRGAAERMIAGVVRAHERVRGVASTGEAYAANDPDLLDWVFATATWGFGAAYHAYARTLTAAELDALNTEGLEAGRLYGALGAPASHAELQAMLAGWTPRLEPSDVLDEFLSIMRDRPLLPLGGQMLQPLLVKAAIGLVPTDLRAQLRLGRRWDLRPWERLLVRQAAKAADRLMLRSSPAVQASLRLGLPADWLYRRDR